MIFSYDIVKHFIYGGVVAVPVIVTFFDKVGAISVITGRSMRPTLNPEYSQTNDRVWMNRWRIRHYKPKSGDIVSLYSPIDPKKRLVKRVIAVEGEVIRTERYKLRYVKIPQGHCWVEGDNIRSSQDSNFFGPISVGVVCGRVTHILWPPNRWKHLIPSLLPHQQERTGHMLKED